MYFLTNQTGTSKLVLAQVPQQKFTIGRIQSNNLHLLDSTVSKNHAVITYITKQRKFIIEDLQTVNGTFVNQLRISKKYLKHDDQIMFGKCQQVFMFKSQNPEPQKKGKINFKDYHFQLEDAVDIKPLLPTKSNVKYISEKPLLNYQTNTQNVNEASKLSQGQQHPTRNKFERAIKIPKFEQFLEIQGQSQIKNNKIENQQFGAKWIKQNQVSSVRKVIKLPQLNAIQLSQQQLLRKKMIQRKRELQRAQKQSILQKTQLQQRIGQQHLRLQLKRSHQQQLLQQERYQSSKKLQKQQTQLLKQKQLLSQKLYLQQKQLQQRQQLMKLTMKQKQQKLMQEIMKEKQIQLLKLKERQTQIIKQMEEKKNQQVKQIQEIQTHKLKLQQQKNQRNFQSRKKQLEIQAQALTRQYQNIYKDTLKKIKLNIQAEQQKKNNLQENLQKLQEENQSLQQALTRQQAQVQKMHQQYRDISGRNKAFLLYASHLQQKIDGLKNSQNLYRKQGFSKAILQLKDSIIQSRKLLHLKLSQKSSIQNSIKEQFLNLNISAGQNQEYLNSVLQNYQEIQRLKEEYFQYLEEEKEMENKWDLQLQANTKLEEKLRKTKKDTQANKKKIADILTDNLKKLTQQRVHMLKMMYHSPEDKKNAAKFLVQEILNIEQQNKTIILDSENIHHQITGVIIQSQYLRRQNQNLSEILFGANSTAHHFDNMRQQINRLMSSIQDQRQPNRINTLLKLSQQTRGLQMKILQQTKRSKRLKDQIKTQNPIIAPLNIQKNPIVFFGKILTKKQAEIQQNQEVEAKLYKQLNEEKAKYQALIEKKTKINALMQDYKRKELAKARFLLK